MNKTITHVPANTSVTELTKIALVAALYLVVTVWLAVISFGVVQLRLSEMFNYLALYHKRYVIAITMGVVLANFLSPMWVLDVPVGGIATFLVLIVCRFVTKKIKNQFWKIAVTAVIFALSMFTVAGQLAIVFGVPFFYTWLTVGLGELFSMTVGGILVYLLRKKIDFTK